MNNTKKKLRKILLIMSSKRIKYLGIHLMKVKDVHWKLKETVEEILKYINK